MISKEKSAAHLQSTAFRSAGDNSYLRFNTTWHFISISSMMYLDIISKNKTNSKLILFVDRK